MTMSTPQSVLVTRLPKFNDARIRIRPNVCNGVVKHKMTYMYASLSLCIPRLDHSCP